MGVFLVRYLHICIHSLLRLDSTGIAGFGHDFRSLDGVSSPISEAFQLFDRDAGLLSHLISLLGPVLPYLLKLPTEQNRILKRMRVALGIIADELLARTRREKESLTGRDEEKSIIGLLSKTYTSPSFTRPDEMFRVIVKAENADAELNMSQEEVMAQARSLEPIANWPLKVPLISLLDGGFLYSITIL